MEKCIELAQLPWKHNSVMAKVMSDPLARPAVARVIGKQGINTGKPHADFLDQVFHNKFKNHVAPFK